MDGIIVVNKCYLIGGFTLKGAQIFGRLTEISIRVYHADIRCTYLTCRAWQGLVRKYIRIS